MKRILLFILALTALPAYAGSWNAPSGLKPGGYATFTWGSSDTGDQDAVESLSCVEVAVTAEVVSGTPSVSLYLVPTKSTATSSGTLVASVAGTGRTPVFIPMGTYFIRPTVTTAAGGGVLHVRCAGYSKSATGGGANVALSELSAYDAVVNFDTGTTLFSTGGFRAYSNKCLQMQEALNPYLDTAVSTFSDYGIRVVGNATITWTDLYDAGPYRYCFGLIPTTSTLGSVPAAGTGGYSDSDSGRTGWPEILTKVGKADRSAAAASIGNGTGTNTRLTDAGAAYDSTYVGQYVEVISSTGGCNGNIRYISSVSSGTVLDVDSSFTSNCTNVTYKVWDAPFRTGGSTHLTITWDDVYFDVNATGQTEPAVVMQRGNGWACGRVNSASAEAECAISNVTEQGSYKIVMRNDVASTGWISGRIPELSASTLVNADKSMIAELNVAILRDIMAMRETIACDASAISDDNIGIISGQTWGSHRLGGSNIGTCGLGIMLFSNNLGRWGEQYVAGNRVGIVFGTNTNGAELTPYSSCLTGYCSKVTADTTGPTFERALLESNLYGDILTFDTSEESGFEDLHIEEGTGTLLNHAVTLGAGQCNATDATTVGRGCAEDADCGSGTCSASGALSVSNDFFFRGGNQVHYTSTTNQRFRHLILGRNATEGAAQIVFDGGADVGWTTVNLNNATAGARPCTGGEAPFFFCSAANTNPATTVIGAWLPGTTTGIVATVHYGDVNQTATNASLFPYQYIKSNNTVNIGPFVNQVNLAAGDAMQIGWAAAASPGAPTVNNSQLWAFPWNVIGNANNKNIYLNKIWCSTGSYDDGAEANESSQWSPMIGDTTSVVALNTGAVTFTEGTDAVGLTKGTQISRNTALFDCTSGTCKTKDAPLIGIKLNAETDVGANNTSKATCWISAIPSFGNDN